MPKPADHDARLARARLALDGLSVGDAFGERYFKRPDIAVRMIAERQLPSQATWGVTDDTVMALSIYETLAERGGLEQEYLARAFARRYRAEPDRGYGAGAHQLLAEIGDGFPWRDVSSSLFAGSGSYGNGGAMRVAPLGAYFADDLAACVDAARASAEVTHWNPEGQAGAIAIAVATVWAVHHAPDVEALFDLVLDHTPASDTRAGIERARVWPLDTPIGKVVDDVGNGSRVTAMDTVPFCIWSIARNPTHYEDAMWDTVAGLGDRDTTCAIVGGVVALSAKANGIPPSWLERREPLPV